MLPVTLLLLSLFNIVSGSDLATFSDKKCSKSLDSMAGVNGYPNGTCTVLSLETTQSFQVVGLDKGCAITLYGPDTSADPCSADILIVGRIATCYNSSWHYYSIDGCDIPSETPSPTPIAISSTSSTPLPSSTSSSSISSSASPSVTSTPSPSPSPLPEKTNHTPLIVGASLGGVGVVALISIAGLLFVRHRRSNTHQQLPPSYELSNDRGLLEAGGSRPPRGEKVVQTELWAHEPAQEIGRNSIYIPPVELAGDSAGGEDKKNIAPLIKVHMER